MSFKIDSFSYEILRGRVPFHYDETIARNEIFNSWFKLWDEVYRASGADFRPKPDEFLRQDLVCCIRYKGQPAALHLYSFFDLQCAVNTSSHYFNFFNEAYLQAVRNRGARMAMSMEYLTVMPEFRKSLIGFSIGAVVSQLGTWVFRDAQADVIVAPARKDLKVDQTAYAIGFECIQKDTVQRGFPCDLIACFQGSQKPYPDKITNEVAEYLYANKKIWDSAKPLLHGATEQKQKRAG